MYAMLNDDTMPDFRNFIVFIGSGLRFSRVWVRKDGDLVTETGFIAILTRRRTLDPTYIYIYIYTYICIHI